MVLVHSRARGIAGDSSLGGAEWVGCTHSSLPLLLFELLPQSEELLVLPGDKINGRILQQCGKHKEETHGHPDVYGFHVGHLRHRGNQIRGSDMTDTECPEKYITVSYVLKILANTFNKQSLYRMS